MLCPFENERQRCSWNHCIILICVCSLLCWPGSWAQIAACSGNSGVAGFTGKLITINNEVAGDVTVTSPCTAIIDNFSYDGRCPTPFFWCSQSTNKADYEAGARAQEEPPHAGSRLLVQITLSGRRTWDDCPVLGVWCEDSKDKLGEVQLAASSVRLGSRSLLAPPERSIAEPPARSTLAPPGQSTLTPPGRSTLAPPGRSTLAPPTPPGGATLEGFNCMDLVPDKFKIYWQLADDESEVTVALQLAEPSTGALLWMAFGFSDPRAPEAQMIGSDVVVAGYNDLLAGSAKGFALDYFLEAKRMCNYDDGQDSGVCPDEGLAQSPTANNAQLVGVEATSSSITVIFTRSLVFTPEETDHPWSTDEPMPAVWGYGALGDTSTQAQPLVLKHGDGQYSGPDFKFAFTKEGTCEGAALPVPEEQPPPADLLAPLDAQPPPAVPPAPKKGPTTPTTPPAPPKAAPGAGGANTTGSTCRLEYGGGLSFDSCTDLTGTKAYFKLYYTVSASGGGSLIKGAMEAETDGWASWALAEKPGEMVPAAAVIATKDASGIKVESYQLTERSLRGIKAPATGLTLTSSSGGTSPGNSKRLVALFEVEVAQAPDALKSKEMDIIYAVGPMGAGGKLAIHSQRAGAKVSLQSSSAGPNPGGPKPSPTSGAGDADTRRTLRNAHAWLMGLTWGVLIPIAIVFAFAFKSLGPVWFNIHHGLNAGSYILSLAGFGIGAYLGKEGGYPYKKHFGVGVAVIALSTLQVVSGWLRPHTDHTEKKRRIFNVFHWWNGRAAAVLGIVNVFYGMHMLPVPNWVYSSFIGFLCILALVAVTKHSADYVSQGPGAGSTTAAPKNKSGKGKDDKQAAWESQYLVPSKV